MDEARETSARSFGGPGILYICGTPIGNLRDITERALEVLTRVHRIAAEDTRHTRKLLSAYGISTPMLSLHEHNEAERTEEIMQLLQAGHDIALVSDAGMPGISDPGMHLVSRCIEAGIPVVPVPGPAAFLTALVASGLSTERFCFEGFLPRKASEQKARLAELKSLPHTLIFYEAPHRIERTLGALLETFGDRRAVLARELTKIHEEFVRGKLSEILDWCSTGAVRGEMVLLVEGATETPGRAETDETRVRERLRALLDEGVTMRDAVKKVTAETGLPRSFVYNAALQVKGERAN